MNNTFLSLTINEKITFTSVLKLFLITSVALVIWNENKNIWEIS